MNNIFSSISKYAARQDENYLTEVLVFVLQLIKEKSHKKISGILTNICGPDTEGWFQYHADINIATQMSVVEGRPDIVITTGEDRVVFIEVKHDSRLGLDQLERYYEHLKSSSYLEKQLVFLTRSKHSIQETTLDPERFHHVSWYQISGWLSETDFKNDIVNHTIQQFLEFLREKEMSMEKITWEYIEGVQAMRNLLSMLGTAIAEADPSLGVKKTMGWSWAGYYLEGNIFLGFRYEDNLIISFENNGGDNPTFKRDLDLEQVHFFSLRAGEQLECLIDFIKETYLGFPAQKQDNQK
jgi:hypothetical protein